MNLLHLNLQLFNKTVDNDEEKNSFVDSGQGFAMEANGIELQGN